MHHLQGHCWELLGRGRIVRLTSPCCSTSLSQEADPERLPLQGQQAEPDGSRLPTRQAREVASPGQPQDPTPRPPKVPSWVWLCPYPTWQLLLSLPRGWGGEFTFFNYKSEYLLRIIKELIINDTFNKINNTTNITKSREESYVCID